MKRSLLCSSATFVALVALGGCAGTELYDVGEIDGGREDGAGGKPSGAGASSAAGSDVGGDPPLGEVPPLDDYLLCDDCEVVADAPGIRAVWVASESVYWTEFGTVDPLGAYQGDGRLMVLSLAGGAPRVIADRLGGPSWLALGERYAYVWLRHSSSREGEVQLARVALASGEVEPLWTYPETEAWSGEDWARRFFAFAGGYAYWCVPHEGPLGLDGTVHQLAESEVGIGRVLTPVKEFARLMADDTNLYIHSERALRAFPLAGGEARTLLSTDTDFVLFGVAGGSVYGSAYDDRFYAFSVPADGGSSQRLANLSAAPDRLMTDGERFVASVRSENEERPVDASHDGALVAGNLDDWKVNRIFATTAPWFDRDPKEIYATVRIWDLDDSAVYLGHGDRLYRVAR